MNETQEVVYCPVKGKRLPLSQISDSTFATEMMGKTYAFKPTDNGILAPVSGKVISVFPTKHAITICSDSGIEILVHVGIDTVELQGKFFDPHVVAGDEIRAGDLLMNFEISNILAAGFNDTVFLIVMDAQKYSIGELLTDDNADFLMPLIRIDNNSRDATEDLGHTAEHSVIPMDEQIVMELGGFENIATLGHCATRLRVTLHEMEQMSLKKIEQIPGVLGVVSSMGGLQIIIGNRVTEIYDQMLANHPIGKQTDAEVRKYHFDLSKVLNVLSDILSPIVPLIMGSGFIAAILVILVRMGLSAKGTTYVLLNSAANVVFYFLPFMLAVTSAKRFKCSVPFSLFLAGLLLHPDFIKLVQSGKAITLFQLPVPSVAYGSSLIPIILCVWILSYVERIVNNVVPTAARYVFQPLLVILIMMPLTLCILGPAGYLLGELVGKGLTFINAYAGWAAVIITSTFAPILVMTGMHIALTPLVVVSNLNKMGYDNLLLVGFLGMNFSQFAVALAVMLKTKNQKLKQIAGSAAFTALLSGITEPTLYGVTVKLKRPFYATFIGCFANGVFCSIVNLKVFAFAPPSFSTIPIFMNPNGSNMNLIMAICAIIITITVTFIATWVIGFNDQNIYTEEE